MSEAEKQRRLLYKLNRQRWIQIFAIILAAIILLTAVFSVLFYNFNKAYYIGYTQNGDVDYRVLLKENDFYETYYAESGKAYITELINKVIADFSYCVEMNTAEVNFEYTYHIDALLEIKTSKGEVIFDRTDSILAPQKVKKTGNSVMINEQVALDYGTYNDFANSFADTYRLKDTQSSLKLLMYIEVIGACEEYSETSDDDYIISINVPLAQTVVNMTVTSTVEEGDNRILARENETAKNVFMILTIVFSVLSVLGIAWVIAFIFLTRSTDINYEIRRNRILQTYKPFIQKLAAAFETEGYQLLVIESFKDMLEIRDTIQSPILMYENDDKTMTGFYIPTESKLLYVHELRIEDYDAIYGAEEDDSYVFVEAVDPTTPGIQEACRKATKAARARTIAFGLVTVLGAAFKATETIKKNKQKGKNKHSAAKKVENAGD